MKKEKKKSSRKGLLLFLLLLLLGVSVGYAVLSQTLTITGSTNINTATTDWNVKFTAADITAWKYGGSAVTVTGAAAAATPESYTTPATASVSFTDTTVSYSAALKQPGDTLTFTATVTNSGTIPAKVSSITDAITVSTGDYYRATVTNNSMKQNDVLAPNASATITVVVSYPSTTTTLPSSNQSNSGSYTINFEQQ